MQITKQADYAVRAVLYLARNPGRRVPTSEIAETQHIPNSFLAKIISQLSISGIVQTWRGVHGGVTLARDPEDLTLLEVVEAIDGPIRLNTCVGEDGYCPFKKSCPMTTIWNEAQQVLVEKLKTTYYSALLRKAQEQA